MLRTLAILLQLHAPEGKPDCTAAQTPDASLIVTVCGGQLQRVTHLGSRTSVVYLDTARCASERTQDPECDADAEPWTETSDSGWSVTFIPRNGVR